MVGCHGARCQLQSKMDFLAPPCPIFSLSMILFDLPSPAEAGFAKAGNRFPLFGIML
jgi:hypothetical protein